MIDLAEFEEPPCHTIDEVVQHKGVYLAFKCIRCTNSYNLDSANDVFFERQFADKVWFTLTQSLILMTFQLGTWASFEV